MSEKLWAITYQKTTPAVMVVKWSTMAWKKKKTSKCRNFFLDACFFDQYREML